VLAVPPVDHRIVLLSPQGPHALQLGESRQYSPPENQNSSFAVQISAAFNQTFQSLALRAFLFIQPSLRLGSRH
jgi:hypothetical protein